jgi:hypothetical protein
MGSHTANMVSVQVEHRTDCPIKKQTVEIAQAAPTYSM